MENLPLDVLRAEIFSRCAEYRPALRAVCRQWLSVEALMPGDRDYGDVGFLARRNHIELLIWAVGERRISERLIEYKDLMTILLGAARGGHEELCILARSWSAPRGVEPQMICGLNYNSMLTAAARHGHQSLCQLAVKWGATDWSGMLAAAARGGHTDLCRLGKMWWEADDQQLVAERERRNAYNHMLEGAARGGHVDTCLQAVEWGANTWDRMIGAAAEGGHEDLCRLAMSYNPEEIDLGEMLICAALNGHLALCRLAKTWNDLRGTFPLDWNLNVMLCAARQGGHEEICQLAISWGASVEAVEEEKFTYYGTSSSDES